MGGFDNMTMARLGRWAIPTRCSIHGKHFRNPPRFGSPKLFHPFIIPSAGQMWQWNKSGNSRTIIELNDGFSTMFDTRHCQTGASQSPIFSDFLVEETGSPSRWILPACCPALVAPAGPAKIPREGDVFAPGNSMINRALLVDEPKWLIYIYVYIYMGFIQHMGYYGIIIPNI